MDQDTLDTLNAAHDLNDTTNLVEELENNVLTVVDNTIGVYDIIR
jgi:hypothetical protein